MRQALVTGGTQGLGRALVAQLAADGWRVVFDARSETGVTETLASLAQSEHVAGVVGDVNDPHHRTEIRHAIGNVGLDLLVNNASTLGASPLPPLATASLDDILDTFRTNAIAPLALVQMFLEGLRTRRGVILNITSDAAIEPYAGWGGYGASKAALDQLSAVLAAEEPDLVVYAFDPGDMHTDMHQRAFPGDDISDRPAPATVVPVVMDLLAERPVSGRYTATARSLAMSTR